MQIGRTASAEVPLTDLRQHASKLLRYEATQSDAKKKHDAATALCDLYVVLRQDDRYSSSEMLQQDASKIRRRLITIATKREAKLKREKITRPSNLSSSVDSAIERALSKGDQTQDDSSGGGQKRLSGNAAGGAFDNGWQLVELIQRIVAPDFWDVQGGPGTIRYFAMRRVLVVRATTDVHEQIKDLLIALTR